MKFQKLAFCFSLCGLLAYNACTVDEPGDTPVEKKQDAPKKPEPVQPCQGNDCPCEGDGCTDPQPCQGPDCPCEGDNCNENPEPPAANIILNGSFEEWEEVIITSKDGATDSALMPKYWNGDKSDTANGNSAKEKYDNNLFIYQYDTASHDGKLALQAQRTANSNQRFLSQPVKVRKGEYKCTYWARGNGEVGAGHASNGIFLTGGSVQYANVTGDAWRLARYDFSLTADSDAFQFVLYFKNTSSPDHIQVDDIVCTAQDKPCDKVTCEAWQICADKGDNDHECLAQAGYCATTEDCGADYLTCDDNHKCVAATDRCLSSTDCAGSDTCDTTTHYCQTYDYCSHKTGNNACVEWTTCSNEAKTCVLNDGACWTSADCVYAKDKPVCDIASHSCVGIDSELNVFKFDTGEDVYISGDFEEWIEGNDYVSNSGYHKATVPAGWFGLKGDAQHSTYFPENEITEQYYAAADRAHSGDKSFQVKYTKSPAIRITSLPFYVEPGKTYSCTYYVSGHGDYRHRYYCGGWGKDTKFATIDSSSDWEQVSFELKSPSGSSECFMIFYVGSTKADEHLLLDDISCSLKY